MAHGLLTSRRFRLQCVALGAVAALVLLVVALSGRAGEGVPASEAAYASAQGGHTRMTLVDAAAREFGTPASLLLALSYNESRWQDYGASLSVDGGYGLMNLTARTFPAQDGRGDPARPAPRYISPAGPHDTLDAAARLLNVSAATLETNDRQNIRGAAAVLASYARRLNGGTLPSALGGWYAAVAEYSGDTDAQLARSFADGVFATLRGGAALVTADGQAMALPAEPGVRPDTAPLSKLGFKAAATLAPAVTIDCPSTVSCRFVPAAYAQDDPADPSNYGNYDTASRPSGMKINYIIIHDTEGSYNGAISTFQNPSSYVSSNYVIRSSDGAVTEMVPPQDVAWGAGDWYVNMHAINIEHEGFAAQGRTWYTAAMYKASATLVRYLATEYHIPLDRAHILGHEDVPGPTNALTAAQHWDPGPFWNWNHFMALVQGVSDSREQIRGGSTTRGTHHIVTIDPTFGTNKQTVRNCSGSTCSTLPSQPTNFVYIRIGPGSTYPLIGDPVLRPGSSAYGTTVDSDWGDKATTGERFVFAGQSGNWTAIWFRGRKGWFYNPAGLTGRYAGGTAIKPASGRTSIPVYGVAYPEASAYPAQVPVKQIAALTYAIPAGEAYTMTSSIPTDYYYAPTIDSSLPDDHTVIIGKTVYYQIGLNHRVFYVRATDVVVQSLT